MGRERTEESDQVLQLIFLCVTIRELFDFIVDPCIADDGIDSYLEKVQQKVMARGDMTAEEEIADAVFVQSYIPKTLDDVKNAEADVIRLTSGEDTRDMYYNTITGLKEALPRGQPAPHEKDQQHDANAPAESPIDLVGGPEAPETDSDSDTDEEGASDSDGNSDKFKAQDPLDKKAARKENNKKVKEEKREARKTKVPKADKKREKDSQGSQD